jgi:RHS repeat-associated protein
MIQANGTLYKINALEQRIEKQGAGANTPSGTRQFVYDEMGHLIGEYDPVSGSPMIEHVWLWGAPVATIKNSTVYYVYPDHLGTPRAITNASNQTVWYWNYNEPFGKTEANENPSGAGTFSYNLRFPGQYFDSETGLHYNWHRDYNPEIGKYAQSDPAGLRGGLNTFWYVGNNPARYFDYYGLDFVGPPAPPPVGDWNNNPWYIASNNCYSHAMGIPGRGPNGFGQGAGMQPGDYSGQRYRKLTCDDIKAAAIRDGAKPPKSGGDIRCEGECPDGHYKIHLIINEGGWLGRGSDYHWYRQHGDGSWTDKFPGGGVNRSTAGCPFPRLGYDTDCGFLCVKN